MLDLWATHRRHAFATDTAQQASVMVDLNSKDVALAILSQIHPLTPFLTNPISTDVGGQLFVPFRAWSVVIVRTAPEVRGVMVIFQHAQQLRLRDYWKNTWLRAMSTPRHSFYSGIVIKGRIYNGRQPLTQKCDFFLLEISQTQRSFRARTIIPSSLGVP